MGLTCVPEVQPLIFSFFLSIYLINIIRNQLLFLAVSRNSHLHNPCDFIDFYKTYLSLIFVQGESSPKVTVEYLSTWPEHYLHRLPVLSKFCLVFFYKLSSCDLLFPLCGYLSTSKTASHPELFLLWPDDSNSPVHLLHKCTSTHTHGIAASHLCRNIYPQLLTWTWLSHHSHLLLLSSISFFHILLLLNFLVFQTVECFSLIFRFPISWWEA